jgi:hypothetical protein
MRAFLVCIIVLRYTTVYAQSLLPSNTVVNENFNGIGAGTSASLPSNWKMSAAGLGAVANWTTATNVTVLSQAASNGTPATGGRYNWATTAGTDRAIGFMTDGAYASPNAILAYYRNTTGGTITTVNLSFDIERYRINTGNFSLSFFSSTDGTTWVVRSAGDIATGTFLPGASAYTFSIPQTLSKKIIITGLNIPNNGDIYFRWVFTNGTNSQGIGLDNVNVLAGSGTPDMTATLQDQLNIDVNSNSQADEGDGIRYKATIRNKGADTARGVAYNNPTPVNTTLVGGSVKTSALARDDQYSTPFNTMLSGQNLLTNDFGLPTISVVSFGPTANSSAYLAGSLGLTDNGGAISVSSAGILTYTPLPGFTGTDRFSYIATTLPGGSLPDNEGVVTITVGAAATAIADNYNCIGNVSIVPNAAAGVLANDLGNGKTVVAVNGNTALVGFATTTTQGGNLILNADGSFSYDPPRGYEGNDQFNYTIDNGFSSPSTVTATVAVSGMIWFVANGGAAGDGRLSSPYNSVTAFQGVNNGTGANPATGDHIFIFESASAYPSSAISLLQNQKLVGQDAAASLASITGYSVPAYSTPLPVTNTAGNTATLSNNASIITLATNGGNLVQGLTLTPSAGSAVLLSGAASGNHTMSQLIIAASGTANGINLATTSYGGSFTYGSGSITNSGTGTSLGASGSTANITVGINISQTGNGPMVNITNHATGTILFQAGTLTASNGNGLQFTNADGTYNFNGTTTLNGGDAGIDILNGSGGTFSFSTNTTITNPSGSAFNVDGTTISVTAGITYSGSITQNTSGQRLVNINTTGSGTISFQTGTLSGGSAATGINLNAVNGNVSFANGLNLGTSGSRMTSTALTMNGGTGTYSLGAMSVYTTGVTALNATNADGTINSGSGTIDAANGTAVAVNGPAGLTALGITLATLNSSGGTNNISLTNCTGSATLGTGALSNASGTAFNVSGGNATISYAGTITKSTTGRLIDIQNRTANNITLSGALSSTGTSTGINVSGNTGGTIEFSAAKTINTGASAAVTLSSNTGATINFTNGSLAITTTSGNGFAATGGGTVNVTGTVNSINSTTGIALNVSNTNIGASGLIFESISANGGANGIILSSTGTTAGLTVTGIANQWGSGGTIRNTTGADGAVSGNGIYLNNTRNISLSYMLFNDHQNNGIFGTAVRGFSIHRTRFTGNHGTSNSGTFDESVLRLADAGGAISITNSYFSGGAYNSISIQNTFGTAPVISSLFADSDTLTTMQGSVADVRSTAFIVELMDGSLTTGTIQNCRATYWWGNAIHVLCQGTSSGTINILNNFCDNTNGALAGAGGIWVAGGSLNYTINGNTVRHTNGTAISADRVGPGALMDGTISNNNIGVSGDANSGSATGIGIFASHHGPNSTRVRIQNNILRQINGSANGAITVNMGDNVGFGGSGNLAATITGNNIQESGTTVNNAQHGILVTVGATSGDTDIGCYDIGGPGALANIITNFNSGAPAASQNRIRVNHRFTTTARFPGYTGAQFDNTALATYLLGRNTASNSLNATSGVGGGFQNTAGGAPCQ